MSASPGKWHKLKKLTKQKKNRKSLYGSERKKRKKTFGKGLKQALFNILKKAHIPGFSKKRFKYCVLKLKADFMGQQGPFNLNCFSLLNKP